MARAKIPSLARLARSYGVQTAYYDVAKHRRQPSPEALLQVLKTLGAPVERPEDVPEALRQRHRELAERCLEPIYVAWDGEPARLEVRMPGKARGSGLDCHLKLEGGETRSWRCDPGIEVPGRPEAAGGEAFVTKRLALPGPLPLGYHRLEVTLQGRRRVSLIVAAPRRAYSPGPGPRAWGVFLPLYALHSKNSWGCGDFSDLDTLAGWVAEMGGDLVGTLPLLPSFLEEPFDPSPYSPVSRLFWNELYVDPARAPELKDCPEARRLLESSEVQEELQALRSSSLVDYRRLIALKRRVLEMLARRLFAQPDGRLEALLSQVEENPALEDYARFRAAGESQGSPWQRWPGPLRDGRISEADFDQDSFRYHLYSQWLAHEQVSPLAERGRAGGPELYLDFPLGVNPQGYDVWRERDSFASGISAGAPPDAFFTKGQNWGFPPIHPERVRAGGYRYLIESLRHHMKASGILRIDHVMGLHRLFWVPDGMEAREGTYVRYPAEELYAILSLESHRHRCTVVGENLGTVPYYVNPAMSRHNISRMYVLQYEMNHNSKDPFRAGDPNSLASLNTHDMPPFAAYWKGLDIEDRKEMGLMDEEEFEEEKTGREGVKKDLVRFLESRGFLEGPPEAGSVLRASLAHLGASRARAVLVNLEDLWLETEPQNVPGTVDEHPNWRRKAAHGFEAFCRLPEVTQTVKELDNLRKRNGRKL